MLQDRGIKKIQELKAKYTPSWVNLENIFSRFKALKLSEDFSEFKEFKTRGFDFKNILSVLVSMVVSPDKSVNSYLNVLKLTGVFISSSLKGMLLTIFG